MGLFFVILMLCSVTLSQQQTCQQYLQQLVIMYQNNQTKFQETMGLYFAYSGKYLEDLGFPQKCITIPGFGYTTLEFKNNMNGKNVTTYYGLCFSQLCNGEDIMENKVAIIKYLNQKNITNITNPQEYSLNAVTPRLKHQTSAQAIVMIIIFCLLISVQMVYSVKKWIKQCSNEEETEQRYTFEDGQVYQEQQITFWRKVSLEYKFQKLFSPIEKTPKIISFSLFKIACIPILIIGQEFYFRNWGAFNLFSFKQQIYSTFYSKIAVFSVYLPDVLFFISAYLLATKCMQHAQDLGSLLQHLLKKVIRLYPIYIAILLIYWLISPSLHQGPVWYVYQKQAQVCNSRWWASIFLIGNWFSSNCYFGAWFVEAEFQFVIFSLVFFYFFSKFKVVSIIFYLLCLIVMLVLTIVLSSKMPVSIENTVDEQFTRYYISSHAHFFFYLLGIGVAMVKKMETLRDKITTHFQNTKVTEIVIQLFGLGLLLLVLFRPSIWSGGSQFEFALSRIGVFLGFLTFFLGGIFKPEDYENTSVFHRLSYYTYPIMLIGPIITLSSVWGLSSFYYVNGLDLLNMMVTQTILSVVVGTFLGIILESSVFKKEND